VTAGPHQARRAALPGGVPGRVQPARILRAIPERDLQQWVGDLCAALHLIHYHTHNSRNSAGGFPDSVIVGTRILFRELKREHEALYKLPDDQETWRDGLIEAGADWAIWRPSDWFPSGDYPRGRIRAELEAITFKLRGGQ
jgi:hypothetical protein